MKQTKRNKWPALLFACCAALALTACQLADPDAASQPQEGQDRLIGAFITIDSSLYTDDMEDGRLYATRSTVPLTDPETGQVQDRYHDQYTFEGVEGIRFFAATVQEETGPCITSFSDNAISDGKIHVTTGDKEDLLQLEGIIYYDPLSPEDIRLFQINPVYQTEDGRVYAMSGQSVSGSGMTTDGFSMSQTLDESVTATENAADKAWHTTVAMSFTVMHPPERIVVLEMSGQNTILSRTEYVPGALPSSLTVQPETQYILVESWKQDENGQPIASRELFDAGSESFKTYARTEQGLVCAQETTLVWDAAGDGTL